MTSIGAIGRSVTPVYPQNRVVPRASDSTPTPAASPIDRVDKLTRQLDASLSNRLARIRSSISTDGSASTSSAPTSRRLDIGA